MTKDSSRIFPDILRNAFDLAGCYFKNELLGVFKRTDFFIGDTHSLFFGRVFFANRQKVAASISVVSKVRVALRRFASDCYEAVTLQTTRAS